MSKDHSLRVRMQDPAGQRVLIVGFARSGRAAADFFRQRGAVVTVSDSRPPWCFAPEMRELLSRKIGVEFGQHGADTFVRQDVIIASPGILWDLPALAAARERGVPVVAEVEAASWFLRGSLVGITGSNGKTTTTTLIGRMLEASGFPVFVGGNIGVPLISQVERTAEETVSVVELSSFQLEGIESFHPQAAVVLNITPNHLDRHPSFEAYVKAKARIFRNQTEDDYAVLNADDPAAAGLVPRTRARKVFFSRTQELPEGVLVSAGKVVYRVRHLQRELFSPRDARLRGDFNLDNVLAATATACVLGADFDAIARAVREFRGVEHRLELAGEVLGVEFYNDSKATSVDATAKALGAFGSGVHLILGGKDKGASYAPLIPLLKGRVRQALLIGAASERIKRELAGAVELIEAGNLETATRQAFSKARPGEVILLSPACSSYDQFQDFEERGRKFKELVHELAQETEARRARGLSSRAERLGRDAKPQSAPRREKLETLKTEVFEAVAPQSCEPVLVPPGDVQTQAENEAQASMRERSAGEPAIRPAERVYVYELDAEERLPADLAPMEPAAGVSIDEVALDRGPRPDLNPVPRRSALADELFIFEVPVEDRKLTVDIANRQPAAVALPTGRQLASELSAQAALAGQPPAPVAPVRSRAGRPKLKRHSLQREETEDQPAEEEDHERFPGM